MPFRVCLACGQSLLLFGIKSRSSLGPIIRPQALLAPVYRECKFVCPVRLFDRTLLVRTCATMGIELDFSWPRASSRRR